MLNLTDANILKQAGHSGPRSLDAAVDPALIAPESDSARCRSQLFSIAAACLGTGDFSRALFTSACALRGGNDPVDDHTKQCWQALFALYTPAAIVPESNYPAEQN